MIESAALVFQSFFLPLLLPVAYRGDGTSIRCHVLFPVLRVMTFEV